jgi:hypothetical protein
LGTTRMPSIKRSIDSMSSSRFGGKIRGSQLLDGLKLQRPGCYGLD